MFRDHWWWSVVGILMCGCASMQSQSVLGETTICSLVGSDAVTGHIVRVRAIYITDLRHGALLKDQQCKSVSLAVLDVEGHQVDSSVKEFDETVWGEIDDLSLRVFRIDVSGIFLEKSVESAQGTFVIQRVWDYKRLEGEDWKTEK